MFYIMCFIISTLFQMCVQIHRQVLHHCFCVCIVTVGLYYFSINETLW